MNKICYLFLFIFMAMSSNAQQTFINGVNCLSAIIFYTETSTPQETTLENLYFYDNNGLLVESQSTDGIILNTSANYDIIIIDVVLFRKSNSGLCVVDGNGIVIQFLSFGDIIVASDGPAAGLTSENIVNQSIFAILL